ncbi:FAD-dependent oxidoreductase [Methylobacterium sp. E-045]|uniref:FAD-dependent oxidoreductase n=1 Tax=Methylobacterium sp. E-045 TaxID=2836575 RepID=UPI001FBB055F|nr:FAD-dependent oxidoreductase [Methylobacterium sp. E-045]MCJ2127339.1 FAD-dependent oxidoreductase [Methylobacterium sp. E-045]
MAAFAWSLSTSACVFAIRHAEMGVDVNLCGAWAYPGEMAATGLGQTDREIISASKNYWGFQKEFFAGGIFPSMQKSDALLRSWLNRYPARTIVDGKPKGKITWMPSAELTGVKMNGNVLEQVTAGGTTYDCWNAFDGSDENDLAKAIGLPMALGRESRNLTGEKAAGLRVPQLQSGTSAIDPVTGNRLPWLKPRPRNSNPGDGDSSTMAFNTRTIITDDPNRIQFADQVVPGYNPSNYDREFYLANIKQYKTIPGAFDDILQPVFTYNTYDMNSAGILFGNNSQGDMFDWHNSTFAERKLMWQDYVCRKAGLFKAICSDPRWAAALPEMVADTKRYGMVPNLWQDSIVPGWPPMMYIRESFRLRAQETIREQDVYFPATTVAEPIATYAYHMDRHPAGVWASANGFVASEGTEDLEQGEETGLLMPWGACKPPIGRCKNVSVGRGIGGTSLGRVKMRIEISQMKIADSLAIIAATSEKLGLRSSELDYQTQVKPALLAQGAVIAL